MEIIRKKIDTSDYENAMEANLGILARQQKLCSRNSEEEIRQTAIRKIMSLAFE